MTDPQPLHRKTPKAGLIALLLLGCLMAVITMPWSTTAQRAAAQAQANAAVSQQTPEQMQIDMAVTDPSDLELETIEVVEPAAPAETVVGDKQNDNPVRSAPAQDWRDLVDQADRDASYKQCLSTRIGVSWNDAKRYAKLVDKGHDLRFIVVSNSSISDQEARDELKRQGVKNVNELRIHRVEGFSNTAGIEGNGCSQFDDAKGQVRVVMGIPRDVKDLKKGMYANKGVLVMCSNPAEFTYKVARKVQRTVEKPEEKTVIRTIIEYVTKTPDKPVEPTKPKEPKPVEPTPPVVNPPTEPTPPTPPVVTPPNPPVVVPPVVTPPEVIPPVVTPPVVIPPVVVPPVVTPPVPPVVTPPAPPEVCPPPVKPDHVQGYTSWELSADGCKYTHKKLRDKQDEYCTQNTHLNEAGNCVPNGTGQKPGDNSTSGANTGPTPGAPGNAPINTAPKADNNSSTGTNAGKPAPTPDAEGKNSGNGSDGKPTTNVPEGTNSVADDAGTVTGPTEVNNSSPSAPAQTNTGVSDTQTDTSPTKPA